MKGLTIQQLYLRKIMLGVKTWEIRKNHTMQTNTAVAFIASGYSEAMATGHITFSMRMTIQDLEPHFDKHGLTSDELVAYLGAGKSAFVWKLEGIRVLRVPIKVTRKQGQVNWVQIDEAQSQAILNEDNLTTHATEIGAIVENWRVSTKGRVRSLPVDAQLRKRLRT